MNSRKGHYSHVEPSARPLVGSRASRFLKRLDVYLPTLPNDRSRRHFLNRHIEGWEYRYARFLATDGASEITSTGADLPQAADFLLTIAGLARRRSALPPRSGEAKMPQITAGMERAIRSLLVAADQRCPAIIGRAHVLYQAAQGTMPCNPQAALRELRRDAQDLLGAIAATETELKNSTLER